MNGRKTNTPIFFLRARKLFMGLDYVCYSCMGLVTTEKLCVQELCNWLLDLKIQTPGLFFTYRTSRKMDHKWVLWLDVTRWDDTNVLTGITLMSHHWQSILVMMCVQPACRTCIHRMRLHVSILTEGRSPTTTVDWAHSELHHSIWRFWWTI